MSLAATSGNLNYLAHCISGRGNSVPRCCVGQDKLCHTHRRLRVNPKRPDGLLRINYHANQLHNDDSDDDSPEFKNLKDRILRGD